MRDPRPEDDAILDDILCRWSHWARAVNMGRGFNRASLVCGQYRTSRQYDDQNGALDEDIEHAKMRAVDFEIGEMEDPWKAAIYVNARALVVGVMVFTSPRLPTNREERDVIVTAARLMLLQRLTRAGVV